VEVIGLKTRREVEGRPRRRWVDDTKKHLGEIGWDDVGWIDLAYDGDQWREGSCEHGNEP
jgi:transposase